MKEVNKRKIYCYFAFIIISDDVDLNSLKKEYEKTERKEFLVSLSVLAERNLLFSNCREDLEDFNPKSILTRRKQGSIFIILRSLKTQICLKMKRTISLCLILLECILIINGAPASSVILTQLENSQSNLILQFSYFSKAIQINEQHRTIQKKVRHFIFF